MKSQDPKNILRSWEDSVDTVFHRFDRAASRLEIELPRRIPRPVLVGINRALKLLESRFAIAYLVFFLLASTRAIHWLNDPQFYIEDGKEFYLPAYTQGLQSIAREYASYYHVVPRILSLIAAKLPLEYGPLTLELLALAVQASVSAFLLSRRMAKQLPSKLVRFALAFFIIADPNSNELFANVTHSQWYLVILSLAILFSEAGRRSISQLGDGVLLFLTGLTGPFAPIMAIFGFSRLKHLRSRWPILVVTILTALVTAVTMIQHPRNGINEDASATRLFRLLANQILYGTNRGFHYAYHTVSPPTLNFREFGCTIFAVAVIIGGLWRATSFVKALGWLGLYCLIASLVSQASWNLLGCPGVGERYFFILDIVYAYGLYALSRRVRSALIRWCFRGLLAIMAIAMVQEWVYDPPFRRFEYAPQIARFNQLPPGYSIYIRTPIDRKSPHDFWILEIPKKD